VEDFLAGDEPNPQSLCAKGNLASKKEMDFPEPTMGNLHSMNVGCLLRGSSEVEVMKPVRHFYCVNLPFSLDFSGFG